MGLFFNDAIIDMLSNNMILKVILYVNVYGAILACGPSNALPATVPGAVK